MPVLTPEIGTPTPGRRADAGPDVVLRGEPPLERSGAGPVRLRRSDDEPGRGRRVLAGRAGRHDVERRSAPALREDRREGAAGPRPALDAVAAAPGPLPAPVGREPGRRR